MSDREWDSSDWHLGMDLPSRKDKHGRKKKGDRKLEKQQMQEEKQQMQEEKQQEVKPEIPVVQVPERARTESIQRVEPEPSTEAKPVERKTFEAVPEGPQYSEPAPAEDKGQQQEAIQQLQAYWDESAATAVMPLGTMESGASGREMGEDEQYLRDLLLQPGPVAEEAAQPKTALHDPKSEAEDGPVISKWKIALLILITPIVLAVVLAWGKLAYVHQVPGFVQQQVPAYQNGHGFLILKPWWFGPPIFTLDQYERVQGEDFEHWKIQLNDYEAVVHDPNVIYTFPQDILK